MNRSYSKIRHIQEVNKKLEERRLSLLTEQVDVSSYQGSGTNVDEVGKEVNPDMSGIEVTKYKGEVERNPLSKSDPIYQKIKETCYPDDLAFPIDLNIENWTKQGVLMLNSALTVEKGNAGSHLKQWDFFTKAVLEALNELPGHIFVLWGKDAQKYKKYLNPESQYILECSHPASATYTGGVWECDHFNEINRILQLYNGETIDWLELPHTVTHLKDFKIDQ
jgi:hypothetical protein